MATSFTGKAKTARLGPRSRSISLCVLAATLMDGVGFLPFGQTLENPDCRPWPWSKPISFPSNR